ncbi:TorF family putative porin [Desulfatitalea alkaliphila]|uniref:TorF family putative porin n=1 Tax=Desulfatitalea alkaliphila TaxID=2929485 RepID=A0AA41R001_9BACT|nr:TorF family putative porin [Desulfatitalea alkaliphila]MCJ8499567.1 TorF family putative porin [Desulfatitalea alkaliphila]
MKKSVIGILLIALLAFSGTAYAQNTYFGKDNFGATIYLTTDYVSRGVSFSDKMPAIQGTVDYFNDLGIFAGIWASSWHSGEPSNDLELGYYLGYGDNIGNLAFSVSANYYDYPGADDDEAEWNYWEFVGTLSYTFADMFLSPTLGVGYTYSPEFSGDDGVLNYYNASLDLVLPWNLGLGLEGGYYDREGGFYTGGGRGLGGKSGVTYYHWRAGLSTTLVGFGLDLSYHNTNEREYFDGMGGDKYVFTLSRSF